MPKSFSVKDSKHLTKHIPSKKKIQTVTDRYKLQIN